MTEWKCKRCAEQNDGEKRTQTQLKQIGKYWIVASKDGNKYTLKSYRWFLLAAIEYNKRVRQ